MPAFTDDQIDWRRIDVQAIVGHHGIAAIDIARHAACEHWLRRHDYRLERIDCAVGMAGVLERLDALFRWEEQFGYRLIDGSGNLDALRDGFAFDVPVTGGLVFVLGQPDVLFREDSRWFLGLLAIASEHSRYQLACGRRFFTLLVLPDDSPMIGQKFDSIAVPGAFWSPCDEVHRFVKDDV